MFGRIFGRGKDDRDQAVCVDCGRTLLAGEWTQTVIDDFGEERLICSLCAQAHVADGGETAPAGPAPANNGRVRETRSDAVPETHVTPAPEPSTRDPHADSDAFWQALKEKDAEIERLQAQLARAEAERQELAGRFARLGTVRTETPDAGPVVTAAPVIEPPSALTGDSSEPGERTWGETPAEFATELAALQQAEADATPAPAAVTPPVVPVAQPMPPEAQPVAQEASFVAPETQPVEPAPEPEDQVPPAIVFEDTQPIAMITDDMLEADDESTGEIAAVEAAAAFAAAGDVPPGAPSPQEAAPAAVPAAVETPASPAPGPPAETAADAQAAAATLTLLQRGVDLLNVSRVPRKIAETNEQLGLPHVHVGFDGDTVAVTFLWSMGWYKFHVDIDSGDVAMSDRGYEERADLRPNAGVRADGTVQLAPAQISRAAAQRTQPSPEPAAPADRAGGTSAAPTEPETPRVAAQKPPEILSKSLLGQRSDDESASWEKTQARDFDWDR